MRWYDFRQSTLQSLRSLFELAEGHGGRVRLQLASEEDASFVATVTMTEWVGILVPVDESREISPGESFTVRLNFHIKGMGEATPEIEERFRRLQERVGEV